ncbi:lipopolysaccharide assembly protein LapB [Vitiosangium sp. GDMCC 1.1324]|uniref:tetratricopeptide repeat protein n=1 Tax=Vitiosangium sp. (strain GDMCC 1.1324) TaxID=2138576 RepID=UPI000D3CFE70|nr:tetratricopeptide repeat protein [Vitiosangium sp. GDMCC 1.1324]PTL85240.1 acetylglucosamine transferase [Vitiosangium sp. GDMCC 1.1324]
MHSRWRVLPLLVLLAAGCEDRSSMPGPKEQAEGYYLKGNTEYLAGKFDEALASYNTMKELSPDDPRLPAAIGEVYLSMGRLNDAAAQFDLALKRDSKRSTNWSRLGFIHAQLGRLDEAQSALRKALALNPKDFNALEQLAEIHVKRGEKDAAVKHFVLAAEACPDASKSPLVLRAVDVLTGDGRHADALLLLGDWTGKGVRTPELLTALGDEQVRAGQLVPAATSYREAAGNSPKDPTLWELVGEIYTKLDKPADALAAYRESLRIKDRSIVHVAMARIHFGRNERQAAEEELGHALETVSGSDVHELTELADLLSTFGRKPDALRILINLSAEPDQSKELSLQLRTAALARELKDEATVRTVCERIASSGVKLKKCP